MKPATVKPECDCAACLFADAADRVLATGEVIDHGGYVLVSDHVIDAATERGLITPPTWTLRRDDGRSVHVFKLPDAAA